MRYHVLRESVIEAERFIAKANAILKDEPRRKVDDGPDWIGGAPKQTGAVRRASMDLTRILATLRRYE